MLRNKIWHSPVFLLCSQTVYFPTNVNITHWGPSQDQLRETNPFHRDPLPHEGNSPEHTHSVLPPWVGDRHWHTFLKQVNLICSKRPHALKSLSFLSTQTDVKQQSHGGSCKVYTEVGGWRYQQESVPRLWVVFFNHFLVINLAFKSLFLLPI